MPTPDPIGKVRFTEPRAVYVRESNDVENVHSAVHGTVAIYTDNYTQAQTIMAAWSQLMTDLNAKIELLLTAEQN